VALADLGGRDRASQPVGQFGAVSCTQSDERDRPPVRAWPGIGRRRNG